jgi:hypothetical protein
MRQNGRRKLDGGGRQRPAFQPTRIQHRHTRSADGRFGRSPAVQQSTGKGSSPPLCGQNARDREAHLTRFSLDSPPTVGRGGDADNLLSNCGTHHEGWFNTKRGIAFAKVMQDGDIESCCGFRRHTARMAARFRIDHAVEEKLMQMRLRMGRRASLVRLLVHNTFKRFTGDYDRGVSDTGTPRFYARWDKGRRHLRCIICLSQCTSPAVTRCAKRTAILYFTTAG